CIDCGACEGACPLVQSLLSNSSGTDNAEDSRSARICCFFARPVPREGRFYGPQMVNFFEDGAARSMEHSTEILYNNTEIYCTPAHRFGSDALLLARFCT